MLEVRKMKNIKTQNATSQDEQKNNNLLLRGFVKHSCCQATSLHFKLK